MVTYPPTVTTVINGEKVNAGVTNRPLAQLVERTDFLKARLDELQGTLSALTLFDQPVGDLVLDSQIVYFKSDVGKFEQAIAELTSAGAPPIFTPTARSHPLGIAVNIRGLPGSKIADIVVQGRIASPTATNLIQTTESTLVGKPYYLTVLTSQLGRATSTVPGLRVKIGEFLSDGSFIADLDELSLGEDHIHFTFDLDNSLWTDTGPDVALTGAVTFTAASQTVTGVGTLFTTEVSPGDAVKLVADDLWYQVDGVISDTELTLTVLYAGTGGAGAGKVTTGPWLYPGTEFDPFPPIPFESAILVLNGHVLNFGTDYTVDTDGVHLEIASGAPTQDGLSEFQLFYTFPLGQTSPGVTALKSGTDNVRVENCSPGGPPDTGNLKISVIDKIDTISETHLANRAVKTIEVDQATGRFLIRRGPVVEKILPGPGITVTPEDGSGTVTISSTGVSEILEPIPNIVLRNAKESIRNLTSYIEMPEGVRSAFLGKIRLPGTINTSKNLKIIFEMLGETSLTVAAAAANFVMEYNIVDPSSSQSLNKPKLSLSKTVALPFPYVAYDTFSATVFEIPGTSLVPGTTLSFLIRRDDEADTYTGSVGVLHPLYQVSL